ncbi:hypothetical protein [Terricaulis sp.]|uniref:hypothetical protein n=1 Tax=Terricaulis sp. TaxID=2768686 RepID=UPI002AC72E55|nr:hypothetical protein [Terricaulis sp.]MDZ4689857.1 hypothetical protein [Terricaulis sp.]
MALLSVVGVVGGGWAMLQLPNPFATAAHNARLLQVLMTAWLLAAAFAGAAAFLLLAWRTYRLTPQNFEVRGLFGGKTFVWRDVLSITRKPPAANARVLELTFKSGKVRLLLAHYAHDDIAAIETRAKSERGPPISS